MKIFAALSDNPPILEIYRLLPWGRPQRVVGRVTKITAISIPLSRTDRARGAGGVHLCTPRQGRAVGTGQ
jgi:hypothetical protein